MQHSVREEGRALVVSLGGDVDLESSPRARSVLLECVALKRPILVDMSEIHYIDSSGVASLVETFQSARKIGSRFCLVAVSETALRVLQLARLDKVFQIFPTVEAALKDG